MQQYDCDIEPYLSSEMNVSWHHMMLTDYIMAFRSAAQHEYSGAADNN
jgi:hypothetical protein